WDGGLLRFRGGGYAAVGAGLGHQVNVARSARWAAYRLSGRGDVRVFFLISMPSFGQNCWTGRGRWADKQLPDRAVGGTTPSAVAEATTSTRTNLDAPKSCASAQLVGIARETEEVTGAAVGARHPRWLNVASDRADGPGLAIVQRRWWGINDHTPLTAQG